MRDPHAARRLGRRAARASTPTPKGVATRKASGEVLAALAPVLPELWGGSADLAESNNTTMKGEPSFLPADRQTKDVPGGPYGRTLHFGIREHAMGSILNGIALHGGTRVVRRHVPASSATTCARAVRLAALMKLPVTYVWTHDSIGLGEDGPTHQPIEHLAALRAIPGLDVVRPGRRQRDRGRPGGTVLEHTDRPAGLALTRQNLPVFDRHRRSADGVAAVDWPGRGRRARAAYVLAEASTGSPEVILIGTGSEVQLAWPPGSGWRPTASRPGSSRCRAGSGSTSRTQAYQRVGAAAGGQGPGQRRGRRRAWAGGTSSATAARSSSLEHFGASAPYTVLFEQFGFTPDRVVAAGARAAARRGLGDITGTTHRQLRRTRA